MTSASFTSAEATRQHDLTSLITTLPSTSPDPNSPGPARKVYPTEDTINVLLHARSRLEYPYTRISPSGTVYVVVNPLRVLGCMGEEARKRYQADIERTDRGEERQPSVYELAGRVWILMSRRRESQSIVYHGLTGSGKSTASRHLTAQLLHLSSHTKAQRRLSDQITFLLILLDSFGNSKTPINPSASQHGRYFELHFSSEGQISGAKVLAFGLNKSRLGRLRHEERTFHVFYQLLAGASPEERDALNLEEPSMYALLSASNCYRLPGGPFSDDSSQLSELRAAFASLGFKAKHVRSIFTLLTAILLLSNLAFIDNQGTGSLGMTSMDERARVADRQVLEEVAAHLGVEPGDLEAVLVNRTKWVRRDLCSMFLDVQGASDQRDSLMRDLYAILFTFVVEMANKRLAPSIDATPELQIVQLDLPGYQSRTMTSETGSRPVSVMSLGPLVNAGGPNGFDEFSVNFMNEMVQSYFLRRAFEDSGHHAAILEDGLRLPAMSISDYSACVELLRGGPLRTRRLAKRPEGIVGLLSRASEELKGEEREDEKAEQLLDQLTSSFGRQPSFIVNPGVGLGPLPAERHMFAINHYSGQCAYDATDFVDRNADVLDKQLVDLLRISSDGFISKLVSGPGLATEGHPLDGNTTIEAQVSVSPLRTPTAIANPAAGASSDEASSDWPIENTVPQHVSSQLNACLSSMLDILDQTHLWTVTCIRPNDSGHPNSFDKRRVKAQIRSLLLPHLVNRRQVDYLANYSLTEFCTRHGLRTEEPIETVEAFAHSHGWARGPDYAIGQQRLWMGWDAWKEQEDLLRSTEARRGSEETLADSDEQDFKTAPQDRYSRLSVSQPLLGESTDDLLRSKAAEAEGYQSPTSGHGYLGYRDGPDPAMSSVWSEYGKGEKATVKYGDGGLTKVTDDGGMIVREKKHQVTEVIATTSARRWWLRLTWGLTWWIPSFCLTRVGKMGRADIRMAWREKVAIVMMIFLLCGVVLFYIIVFGKLLCPDSAKAWNPSELAEHAGTDDYYASIAGKVYDFTDFYKGQHSDMAAFTTTSEVMLQFAGQDLTNYFPPPMTVACPGLVTSDQLSLMRANFTPVVGYAIHTSGPLQPTNGTRLNDVNWYEDRLMRDLVQYYKGSYVYGRKDVEGQADSASRQWAIYDSKVYDLSDYLFTVNYYSSSSGTDLPDYAFLDADLSALFSTQPGQDITKPMNKIFAGMSSENVTSHLNCLNTAFYVGQLDFRDSARCLVQNYLLLAFSVIIITTIAAKFLAALQLGSKRQPELLDKFVICQVPCYTEGEESLKKTIDSLAVLKYDDKRKLIFIICDGNIIGSGNNRPTPRIVLDILGVDPKVDPEALLFKSIGEGSKQLNYAKVYSGLYEFEGHVVPYVVVVKVGKPTETSKPGNRGKRDSQVLLLQYLNRVHFDAPMCPLELEIYHQMRNVIGIDPTFYEYIFQVDADTVGTTFFHGSTLNLGDKTVMPDSLNRLIACTADDQRIIGICGETKLANENESLTTMIQVYEYYISHHLTKAFESLFGSVTCLPGCFSVYRIRTADKGRPVIISSLVIDEYAEPNVDTLHKKNLFSLGEDRYLTTLMMKHFPTFKMKFTPDAIAHTVAPSRWNVLLSQRRRWINSTIHNLAELLFLPEMCGFCFFSMRFIVFLDLLGTIILPATCVYLIYLIVVVSTGKAAVPVISLAMIGAVYGLQAMIFILKREFMLVGWMVVYILAFPVYSVFLPIYSFWSMDDFSWGNTRKVVGEGNQKTVVYDDDEPFNDSMIPYKSFKEYEANAWETASLHSEKSRTTSHTSNARTARGLPEPRYPGSRAPSMHSSVEIPPGSEYWRDSSPLGMNHSSRNLRNMGSSPSLRPSSSNQYLNGFGGQQGRFHSMAGMSMWGAGSQYDPGPGFIPPTMPSPGNPFDSPMSEHASLRPPTFYPPYAQPTMLGMGAPRNSVMSGLGGYGNLPVQDRMSTFSLATTANQLGTAAPPMPSHNPNPSDDEVLSVLRRYLASQDLMSVTKRQTREAIFSLFPHANLHSKAAWINENIDSILSEP